jgi:branched-chain amino acid aminotransferase
MSHKIAIRKVAKSRISEIDFNNIPFGREFTDHMFEATYSDGKWHSCEIKPLQRFSIHPAMLTLHYGQAIFEGMKATKHVDGRPLLFRPEMHVRRINTSAHRMCMPDFPEDLFLDAMHKLVAIESNWIPPQKGSALYIRPVMFATDEYIGVASSSTYKFMIICLPVGPYYNKPVKLKVERTYVRAVEGGVGEAKTAGNYAASLYPAKLAKEEGFDQVLWMDAHEFKYVQEVGTMNIFFVFKDKIVTPATTGTILKGITRDTLIQMLKVRGIEVEQRKLSIDEIEEAYNKGELIEAFGAGTAAVVANVSLIQDKGFSMSFDESNWVLSRSLKEEFNALRAGEIPDTHGWIVPVGQEVMV